MRKLSMAFALLVAVICIGSPAIAQKLTVKVVNRQDSDRSYSYFVAGKNIAVGQAFTLSGATLSLELPDGRIAVVNCKGIDKSSVAIRRDCRVPMGDSIDVDFHGDKAKLYWPVSLDGKKIQSETYKIVSVLDAPQKQSAN